MALVFFGDGPTAAQCFVDAGAAGMTYGQTLVFASGIESPGCYIDCRKLPAHPKSWKVLLQGVVRYLATASISFDTIASVEVGGIPHASVLGWQMTTPSVWVRKKPKGYGIGGMIGGDPAAVKGKRVLLVEDMGTTGGSFEKAILILREEGAVVEDVILLITYEFPELLAIAEKIGVTLHVHCSFQQVLDRMIELQRVPLDYSKLIRTWLADPWAPWEWK